MCVECCGVCMIAAVAPASAPGMPDVRAPHPALTISTIQVLARHSPYAILSYVEDVHSATLTHIAVEAVLQRDTHRLQAQVDALQVLL